MFAVFSSGGKQHRVTEGEVIKLERLTAEPGEEVVFDKVLIVANGDDVIKLKLEKVDLDVPIQIASDLHSKCMVLSCGDTWTELASLSVAPILSRPLSQLNFTKDPKIFQTTSFRAAPPFWPLWAMSAWP